MSMAFLLLLTKCSRSPSPRRPAGRRSPTCICPAIVFYADKRTPLRTDERPLPAKAKARLCAGGHLDPRLAMGDVRTDAPTVARNSTMLSVTIC